MRLAGADGWEGVELAFRVTTWTVSTGEQEPLTRMLDSCRCAYSRSWSRITTCTRTLALAATNSSALFHIWRSLAFLIFASDANLHPPRQTTHLHTFNPLSKARAPAALY